MNLFEPVDYYCERTNTDLWNEPLNLWSNAAFIIAGYLILKAVTSIHEKAANPGSKLLGWLLIIVGIGSSLFHSFANILAMLADVTPIALFVLVYLWNFLRHITKISVANCLMYTAGFILLTVVVARLSDHNAANGGEYYFGTWISIFGIFCYYCGTKNTAHLRRIGLALILFTLSIVFRTVDLEFCNQWPIGTHIFWHIFNACAIYQMAIVYVHSPKNTLSP